MVRSRPFRSPAGYGSDSGEQRPCARLDWCSARTREGDEWKAARTYQPFCPADTAAIAEKAAELPGAYLELAAKIGDPIRSGGTLIRSAPGSRVLVSGAVDSLLREIAAVVAGWAARVRAVPGLALALPEHPPGSVLRVKDDCRVLAKHATPLLALQPGWTTRLYDLPAVSRPDALDPARRSRMHPFQAGAGTGTLDRACSYCLACGRYITRSRVSGWWWAADRKPAEFCDHQPGETIRATRAPVPPDMETLIGDSEIVQAGEGWLKVMEHLNGADAGLEILDLHYQARKRAGHTPPPRETFDGIPCRRQECSEIALERASPPSDPSIPAMHSECSACGDEMTREEFGQHARRYAAWAKNAGIRKCRRCSLADPKHEECCWHACSCTEGEHPRRPVAA